MTTFDDGAIQPPAHRGVHPAHHELIALLDHAPLRPFYYYLWWCSAGGTTLDGFSLVILGIALPLVIKNYQLSPVSVGLLGAALVVGAAIGGAVGGRLGDRFGRKPIYLADMVLLASSATLASLAPSVLWLLVGESLVGLSVGMDFPIASSYIAEIMPQKDRGMMLVATIAMQSVGMLGAGAYALALFSHAPDYATWQLLLAAESILAVVFLIVRLALPESPRWYMGRGRNREAARVLSRFFPGQKDSIDRWAEELGTQVHHVAKVPRSGAPLGFAVLFSRAYFRRTVLAAVPWLLMDVGTYGIGLFTVILLSALGLSNGAGSMASHLSELARGTVVIDAFLVAGFGIGLWAVPRFGRVHMQIFGFLGMALAMLLLLFAALHSVRESLYEGWIWAGFILFNVTMNMGPNSTTFVLPAELFPTQLRASGAGFAASTAKVGATAGVFCLPLVRTYWGTPTVMLLMAGVCLLGALVTLTFRVQVRGRTLEQQHDPAVP